MENTELRFVCHNCGDEIVITEKDDTFPHPPDYWSNILDNRMVVQGDDELWVCPKCK